MENEIIEAKPINVEEIIKENYIIPLYQREYSWNKDNIYKLVNSIKTEDNIYLGNILIEEMQMEGNVKQKRIVDGQQRITTLLLILYYLCREDYKNIDEKIDIESENEREKLKEFMSETPEKIIEAIDAKLKDIKEKQRKQKEEEERRVNIYKINFYYIHQFLRNINANEKEKLAKDILTKIKIVRITIKNAGKNEEATLNISKVFDTINTTGKPLEAKDKFKVRIYNFDNENKHDNGTIINGIYAEINEKEKAVIKSDCEKCKNLFKELYKHEKDKDNFIKIDSERYDVEDFLRWYQFFLVMKKRKTKEYTKQLLEMNYETFFDGLFDILDENIKLGKNDILEEEKKDEVEDDDNEENTGNILENRKKFKTFLEGNQTKADIIRIDEIKEIYNILKTFNEYVTTGDNWKNNMEAYFSYKMFKNYNRYNWTYRYLPILYFYVYNKERKNETNKQEEKKKFSNNFAKFIQAINKLCAIYSICYSKQINDCKSQLIKEIEELIQSQNIDEYTEEVEHRVDEKIKALNNENWIDLDNVLKNVTETNYRKNIICLILAQNAKESNIKETEKYDRINRLFSIKFDIEHIYARARKELEMQQLEGIGNLMILESSYNKSVGKKKIFEKVEIYKKSKFKIVTDFVADYTTKYKRDENFIKDIDNRTQRNTKIIKEYFGLE